jgi:hypothetical protein
MTDARILYPQFRDEQSDSRYPFADAATLKSTDAKFVIRPTAFIDAVFFIIGGGSRLYISSVAVGAETVSITVGDPDTPARAIGEYAISAIPSNGLISFFDIYGRPVGSLLSSPTELANLADNDIGTYAFAVTATEFVSSVVIPANEPGVRGILADNSPLLTGDIWLIGDRGVVLRHEPPNIIRVDVIGVPLYQRLLCEPYGSFQSKRFLKTINGCPPDAFGNFTITATGELAADTALRVYPQNGTLVIDTAGRSLI